MVSQGQDSSIRRSQAIGMADTQPVSSGSTVLGYCKFRRIEVLITPEKYRSR